MTPQQPLTSSILQRVASEERAGEGRPLITTGQSVIWSESGAWVDPWPRSNPPDGRRGGASRGCAISCSRVGRFAGSAWGCGGRRGRGGGGGGGGDLF